MTPEQYVQEKAVTSGSSFYYASLFLSAKRRLAITAFYAFCKEIDDVVNGQSEPDVAMAKLSWWQQQILESFSGHPQHPVMKALLPWTSTYGIKSSHLLDIISGRKMDLLQTRYLNHVNLKEYCHFVAGVAGEVSALIFGQTSTQTTQYAHELGLALQLTKIIRDVGEDARRGRVYIPLEDLRQHDVSVQSILQLQDGPAFKSLMKFQANRAYQHYQNSLKLLPTIDKRAQKPGLAMRSIYKSLLDEIEASQFPVLQHRVSLTPIRKLWLAWRVQAFGIV